MIVGEVVVTTALANALAIQALRAADAKSRLIALNKITPVRAMGFVMMCPGYVDVSYLSMESCAITSMNATRNMEAA